PLAHYALPIYALQAAQPEAGFLPLYLPDEVPRLLSVRAAKRHQNEDLLVGTWLNLPVAPAGPHERSSLERHRPPPRTAAFSSRRRGQSSSWWKRSVVIPTSMSAAVRAASRS